MNNSISVIYPYYHNGTWVFDDDAVGLVREPFVAGADVIVNGMAADIPGSRQGFTLLFSDNKFPGSEHVFLRQYREDGGCWYKHEQTALMGWLCPALFLYFDNAPETIHVQCLPLTPDAA